MRAVLDLIPLAAFFAAYLITDDMQDAVAALMVATLFQYVTYRLFGLKVNASMLITVGAVGVFGGLTLALDDPFFIMVKPTLVFALFAAILAGSLLMDKNPLAALAGEQVRGMPESVLRAAAWQWVAFFCFLGVMNLVVFNALSEAAWVYYKVFGVTALIVLFTLAQMLRIHRRMRRN